MRKLIFAVLIGLFASVSITSCTEEEVKPQADTAGQGGHPIDPKN